MDGAWYINTPQGPTGPLSEQQLKEYAENGHVLATTHVWREGLPQWDELSAIPLLRRVLAAATARERRVKQAAAAATAPAAAAAAAAGAHGPATAPPDELEFEDDDGTVYEWNPALGKYRPKEDPAVKALAERAAAQAAQAAAASQAATVAPPTYDPSEMTYAPEADGGEGGTAALKRRGPSGPSDGDGSGKRARPSSSSAAAAAAASAAAEAEPASAQQPPPQQEQLSATSVYVTGLPEDATEAEVAAAFARCGVLRPGPDGRPRVRLYLDALTQRPKGDALVCYLKPPSVALALQILDGAPLRPGRSALPMSVSVARFKAAAGAAGEAGAAAGDDGSEAAKKAAPRASSVAGGSASGAAGAAARQLRKERARRERRLLGWDGHDDTAARASRTTVVLSPMFSRDEVRADAGLPALVEGDVAGECARRGLRLARVVAFSRHPRGVVTARFATPEDADACLAAMQGRYYGGRKVEAALWDGITNYRAEEEEEEVGEGGEGAGAGGAAEAGGRRGRGRNSSGSKESESQSQSEEEGPGGKAAAAAGRSRSVEAAGAAAAGGEQAKDEQNEEEEDKVAAAEEDDEDEDEEDEDARLDAFFAGA